MTTANAVDASPTFRSFEITMSGADVTSRAITVRIKPSDLDEHRPDYEQAARNRACRRVWGRGARWQGGGIVDHRGQVWTTAKGGGASAVTDTITMRVEAI